MDTLPVELIASILEHLYYTKGVPDHSTIKACALISPAWTEPAQRLLFRRVTLNNLHHGRAHNSFCNATNPSTERGRTLGQHVRVLELFVGEKSGLDLDDADMVDILGRTPRLYELALQIAGIHQFSVQTMENLAQLAAGKTSEDSRAPLRIRALTLLSCGIQSPILYQLLQVWPCIEFLFLGVEIAAPPPKYTPTFHLYQLTLMRTPRYSILSWLLSTSLESLRIISFRDAPGRDIDPLLEAVGPRLRSLRLMNYSLRAAKVLEYCPNLEEFVIVQLSTLFKLDKLPRTLEHLGCRNLPLEDQSLDSVIEAVEDLPHLRVLTCASQAATDPRMTELEQLCKSKGIQLVLDKTPFWVREDPVYVGRFPRRKVVANFTLMN
ncbi:hypothetical protein OH77DRAFT_1425622 [Trametes cingulata]|nr:hypothetical protein OH77DRAFT_1425622 [Trametes cingulata]